MEDSHQHKACLKNWYQGEYCLKVSIKLYFWGIKSYCSLLIDILSLFVENRIKSDLETRIAHRPTDTVALGFVGHKSNLTGRKTHYNLKIYSVIAKTTKNWFSAIGIFSDFQRCKGGLWVACHTSA